MPIAAAGVAAVGSVAGSVLSAKSAKKAAKQAADAQVQVADKNNALAREIYGKNEGYLNPFVQRGNAAGDAINALLGLGGFSPQMSGGGPATAQLPAGTVNGAGLPVAAGDYRPEFWRAVMGRQINAPVEGNFADGIYNATGTQQTPTPVPATPALTPQQQQQNAFEAFRNSTGYQFRLGEGMNALNTGYAARGLINSGAAIRAAQQYGQNYASNEFGNYMGYLSNQQGVGLSGASALAGVGQNYVNNVSGNNQNAADALSNAALLRGQANNNMWSGIGGALGSVFGSSYGGF